MLFIAKQKNLYRVASSDVRRSCDVSHLHSILPDTSTAHCVYQCKDTAEDVKANTGTKSAVIGTGEGEETRLGQVLLVLDHTCDRLLHSWGV